MKAGDDMRRMLRTMDQLMEVWATKSAVERSGREELIESTVLQKM